MDTLKLFNTLGRKKEEFQSIKPQQVRLYSCGPTVYNYPHIGNLRSYVFPDILKSVLREIGFNVVHVMNITDVGHLTSDADEGLDKIEQAALENKKSAWELAEYYTKAFLSDINQLGIQKPDYMPKATEHITEQIDCINKLEAKGLTYRLDDGIYFDTSKLDDYGKLAGLNPEGQKMGIRVAHSGKLNVTDFALWKFSEASVKRQMEWDSPWGKGFPGWHIECSAMAMKYLGASFDIHTGGTDHIHVHHTNEIAQSEAATGQPFVRYWLHGEHLVLSAENGRMGKSEGNSILLKHLIEEGIDPLDFRYFVLNAHYRAFINYSLDGVKKARNARQNLLSLLRQLPECTEELAPSHGLYGLFMDELLDDLNTPRALAVLWTNLRSNDVKPLDKARLLNLADRLLGLRLENKNVVIPKEVEELAQQRLAYRLSKNYQRADELRQLIEAKGFSVNDVDVSGQPSYRLESINKG